MTTNQNFYLSHDIRSLMGQVLVEPREGGRNLGTDVQLDDVFCFTNFLSGFLFRVRGRVRVRVRARGGFRVRVRVRTSVGG